jgi:hypothetical protein
VLREDAVRLAVELTRRRLGAVLHALRAHAGDGSALAVRAARHWRWACVGRAWRGLCSWHREAAGARPAAAHEVEFSRQVSGKACTYTLPASPFLGVSLSSVVDNACLSRTRVQSAPARTGGGCGRSRAPLAARGAGAGVRLPAVRRAYRGS